MTLTVGAAGPLALSVSDIDFGLVLVGRVRRQRVVLTNTAPRGTPAITGAIRPPMAPFALATGDGTGLRFSLKSGQTRSFVVEFAPTAVGPAEGMLRVRRSDGLQPTLGLRLKGRSRMAGCEAENRLTGPALRWTG